ncbi:MAG: sugar ABC transporter substrate-binding protein [Spirochaetes bacterium]|nr:sugar ABC transporter substrate-binding protein [Spirochaetota bacterium]MBU0956228.1 sugar ABC transporter substrate-binding protein [Spirochaetota bacterium]
MKKTMILVLACALLFGAIFPVMAAAEKEAAAAVPVAISVQVESSWLPHYQAAIERVQAKFPNATITLIETGSFDHLDVIDSTAVTNPDVADVFALPADRIYGLVKNEALAGIDARAMANNVGGFASYDAGLGGNFKINGEYMAFPYNIETLINFVNSANARAAGLDMSKPVEFTALNHETMLVPAFNAWFGVALLNSAGVELLGKDSKGVLFSDLTMDYASLPADKKAVILALFNYWKAHNTAGTPMWDSGAAWGYMDEQFAPGKKAAIRLEGPWSTGALTGHAGAENIQILPITQVTLNGKPLAHWKGGWGLGVNARVEDDAAKMAVAQAIIEEIVNPKFAESLFKAAGKILENVPAATYQASGLSAADKTVIAAVVASYKNAPARPLFTEWGQVWSTWENGMLSWSAVKPATVEAAYSELQAAFKAMMANF